VLEGKRKIGRKTGHKYCLRVGVIGLLNKSDARYSRKVSICACTHIHLTLIFGWYTVILMNENGWRKGVSSMRTVNALKIRNNLGEVLDLLTKTGEPILISKGRQVRAVLITPEQFEKRFLDYQAEEQKKQLLETIKSLRVDGLETKSSVEVLRELRGYGT
jgi:PHD/YefM family antitoxin component YafN of YafNO toxin-antitoxin module